MQQLVASPACRPQASLRDLAARPRSNQPLPPGRALGDEDEERVFLGMLRVVEHLVEPSQLCGVVRARFFVLAVQPDQERIIGRSVPWPRTKSRYGADWPGIAPPGADLCASKRLTVFSGSAERSIIALARNKGMKRTLTTTDPGGEMGDCKLKIENSVVPNLAYGE